MTGKASLKRLFSGLTPRMRVLLLSAAGIVVLALVIFGAAALSSPQDESKTQLTPAEQSEQYYESALVQEAQGNLAEAKELAEKAFKADSTNTKAKSLIVRIERAQQQASGGGNGSSGGSPGSTPTTTTPPSPPPSSPESPFMKPTKNILVFVPKAINWWVLATPIAMGPDGTVAGEPAASSTTLRSVSRAVLAVHDRETPTAATAFAEELIKTAYPQGSEAISVGDASGYFGTDGIRLAAAAFTRGRYAFEVVLTSTSGDPASFKGEVIKLASAFPTQF